jgi:hypothetical protein
MPHGILIISRMPHNFIYNIYYATLLYIISRMLYNFIYNIYYATLLYIISQMLRYYIHNISYTTLLEAIQRYLLGSFCALSGRGSNAGNTSDVSNASAGDPRTSRGCAFALALALALALACSTKGANSLSNSELEDPSRIDLSRLESLEISLF